MEEDKPTEEQIKIASAQFDKLSYKEIMRLGKNLGMMLTATGISQGFVTMISMLKTIRTLQKLSEKAQKAEAKGDFDATRHYSKEILKIIDAQKDKLLDPEVNSMLLAIETNIKKSIENLNAKKV
ncbi:MAG: hypothetical protein QXS81_01450 [Candidatus Micrarchaeaceae archaeon]